MYIIGILNVLYFDTLLGTWVSIWTDWDQIESCWWGFDWWPLDWLLEYSCC